MNDNGPEKQDPPKPAAIDGPEKINQEYIPPEVDGPTNQILQPAAIDGPEKQNSEMIPAGPAAKVSPVQGRPTKLTPARQDKFCKLLRAGNYLETAAYASGVHPSTIYNWLNIGYEQNSGAERNFIDAVKKAAADAEVDALKIAKDGKHNWQSAAWFLERRYPARYGRREFIHDERNIKDLPQDELDALVVEAIAARLPKVISDS